MANKNFLTTSEVGKLLGVSFRTVIRWVQRGLLTAQKLPGRGDHRISVQEVQRFMKEHGYAAKDPNYRSKVLVIYGDDSLATTLAAALKSFGVDVFGAEDSFHAGLLVERLVPDLVVLDMKLPGVDGMDILKTIKADVKIAHIPVLAISGEGELVLNRAKEFGAERGLLKPITNEKLVSAVKQMLKLE